MALVLLLPVAAALAALATRRLPFKLAVPLLSAGIIILVGWQVARAMSWTPLWQVLPLVVALVCSAAGDVFLSTKGERSDRFVLGIALYFIAHVGYLAFALAHGALSWVVFGVLMIVLVPYYLIMLRPRINETPLSVAVLLYLVVSCAAFAAAAGMSWTGPARWAFLAAIALILLSDLFISFMEFLDLHATDVLILPTYYLAHILVAGAFFLL